MHPNTARHILAIFLILSSAACGGSGSKEAPASVELSAEATAIASATITAIDTLANLQQPKEGFATLSYSKVESGPEAHLSVTQNVSVLNETPGWIAIQEEALSYSLEHIGANTIPIQLTFIDQPIYIYVDPADGISKLIEDPTTLSPEMQKTLQNPIAITNPFRGGGKDEYDVSKSISSINVTISLQTILNDKSPNKTFSLNWALGHEFYHIKRLLAGDTYNSSTNNEQVADSYGFAFAYRGIGKSYTQYVDANKEFAQKDPSNTYTPITEDEFMELPFLGKGKTILYYSEFK